jgi:plasmid stability protein
MQNAIMTTSITIRNVPDETHAELAARAALAGQSLQEYLRARLIELARRPDARALVARIAARKDAAESRLSTSQILAYRDHERK